MTLRLTNTMKRTKEPFVPANPDHVAMYVYGPTVCNFAHIGDARRLPQRPGHLSTTGSHKGVGVSEIAGRGI